MKLTKILKFIVLLSSILGLLEFGNSSVLAQFKNDSIELPKGFVERWKDYKTVWNRGEEHNYELYDMRMNIPPYTNDDANLILDRYSSGSGDFVSDINPLDNFITFEDTKLALKIFQKNSNYENEVRTLERLCTQHISDFDVPLDELIKYCEQYLLKLKEKDEVEMWIYIKMYNLYQKAGNTVKSNQILNKMIDDNQDAQEPYYSLLMGNLTKEVTYYHQVINDSLNRLDANQFASSQPQELIPQLPFALLYVGELSKSEQVFKRFVSLQEKQILYGGFGNNYVGVADYNELYLGIQKNLVVQEKYEEALLYADRGRSLRLANRLGGNSKKSTINEIKEIAKSLNTTFVEYSLLENQYNFPNSELLIWVVNPNGEINFRLVNLDELNIKSFPKSLGTEIITRGTIFTNTKKVPWLIIVYTVITGGLLFGFLFYVTNYKKTAILVLVVTILAVAFSPIIDNKIASIMPNQNKNNNNLVAERKFEFNNLLQSSLLKVRGKSSKKLEQYLQDSSCYDNKNCLYQLYQVLIEPIAEFLPTDPENKVVFIPQGNIYKVPFAALMNANGKYLIENHTIALSPSIVISKILHNKLQEKSTQKDNILIVGNPKMPKVKLSHFGLPETLSELPGAEYEAKEIAKLYNTQPLIGEEATELRVRKKMFQASLIHFATHGFEQVNTTINTGVLQPAIILAPSEGNNNKNYDNILDDIVTDGLLADDGSLSLVGDGSLNQMNFRAKLIVLSACETGLGTVVSEGVIGFAYDFFSLGVPSVVVSQWQVPDAATSELMIDFHKNLQAGQNKAQALRQAMLTTMKSNPEPVNWAGFILVGESDTLK
ncbi:CHAT domain-containing protein [Crocosphaera sp. XPORK-15E]|uniref:CHAT domain-containing protein n=1 Tax=Crocosphaera sp. XPORK-15E TaxID=3110247 RepID=UPI002B217BC8|nr:CHAT domain-containing protein [Crocosphaera sp. XPORK-15E]MEA5534292.1 CHAT domain-containing protein [Crocosphaera sp. XPORK-15E]